MSDSVQVPHSAILEGPHVNWKHIDGPLMSWAGEIHRLTLKERADIWLFGQKMVDDIASRRWPHLVRLREGLSRTTSQDQGE